MARKQEPQQDIVSMGTNGLLLATATEHWNTGSEAEETLLQWVNYGIALARAERLVPWAIGDWWNRGQKWGERVRIVSDPNWTGPSYKTCRNYGLVATRFPLSRRRDNLSFSVHAEFAALEDAEADRKILQIERQVEETGHSPSQRDVRQEVKRARRLEREEILSTATAQISKDIGTRLYGVILADPPWRFDVYSEETGMDRSAENHYGTMTIEDICALKVPAAKDCVLFLWRTMAMGKQAQQVMEAWGFESKSEWIWGKDKAGTGYWGRCQHEVLMIGTRGHPAAPSPGLQPNSLIMAPVGRHSEKPAIFQDIIDEMFPTTAKIEMFARRFRRGWDAYGNEAPAQQEAAA